MRYVDLHIHTTASDGSLPPVELGAKAASHSLAAVAITDHDTVIGLLDGRRGCEKYNVEFVPGIELSTDAYDGRLHILGYFISPVASALQAMIRKVYVARKERLIAICEKLRSMGVDIDTDEVFAVAGKGSPGRPHIAVVMKRMGLVKGITEAFHRFLGNNAPAYIPKWAPPPPDAIDVIHKAGGLAIYAHPGVMGGIGEIPKMVEYGIDGLEAFYPRHSENEIRTIRSLAEKYGLLITGGSDYHGTNRDENLLGIAKIKYSYLQALKDRWRERRNVS